MAPDRVVSLVLLAAVAVGFGGWATEGLSGSVGAEATFLPGFATGVWLDLGWDIDGWSVGSTTWITVLPGFTTTETVTAGYTFGPVDLGGSATIGIYPLDFAGLDVYADVGLFDVDRDGFAVSADASLYSGIYPAFDTTLSLDVDASYGVFSLGADLDLGIPGFGLSVLLSGEVRVLDLVLEDGGLTADLGASAFVVPAGDARLWFNMELGLGAFTVTSETDFTLAPFGLAEQRIEIDIAFDGFSAYAWGSFTGDGDLSAGIGGAYDFP